MDYESHKNLHKHEVNLIDDCYPTEPEKVTREDIPKDFHRKIRGKGGKTLPAEYYDTKFGRA